MFKQNEGIIDRTIRVALALVLLLAGLFLLGGLQGSVLGRVVAGIGLFPLITGLTGFCPLYIPLGINTLKKEKELIARCMSTMSGFRQVPADSASQGAEQRCGSCPQSIGRTPNQQV